MTDKQAWRRDYVQVPEEFTAKERLKTKVYRFASSANAYIANEIATLIRTAKPDTPVTLGLITGNSPIGIYKELVRLHREEGLSFKNVVVFACAEYYPITKDQIQSTWSVLHDQLFNHIDIPPENVNIPNGTVPKEGLDAYCREYEEKINRLGLDIMLLGVSSDGSIAMNEPGSSKKSVTRCVHLDRKRRRDVAGDFFGLDAITMGVSTILSAKRIILVAVSENKANVIHRLVENAPDPNVTVSYLQAHPSAEVVVDLAAANSLTRTVAPWTLLLPSSYHLMKWTDVSMRQAVIWLSLKLNKSILKLREDDYLNNSLESLVDARGPVFEINKAVFSYMQQTITGWPGGKPSEELANLSPSERLKALEFTDQGHRVHVAYQTSGNIAVWDEDVQRFSNFVTRFAEEFGFPKEAAEKALSVENGIDDYLSTKKAGHPDNDDIRKVKGLIRETEARNAARYCGVKKEDIHFLYLPFYETGEAKKKDLSDEDVAIVQKLLEDVKPHQIYAAGDLSDPHGTHRVCLMAIFGALHKVKTQDWFQQTQVWLYRGAWQEWEPHMIQMAVPMSPDELLQKRYAIYKHQSQKDPAPFPGSDPREFWQRSEARNRATAQIYDKLGLADYEAMEAFVKYDINRPNDVPL